MVANHESTVFDAFTWKLIRSRAQRVVARTGLSKSDVPDLEQELAFDLFQRLPKYDPRKSPRHAFIARILRNKAASLARRYGAECRDRYRESYSLNTLTDDGEGQLIMRAELTCKDVRLAGIRGDNAITTDGDPLRLDMAVVVSGMPADLLRVCEELMQCNTLQAAMNLGMSRTAIRALKRRIVKIFVNTGLYDYVSGKPRHSSSASRT